MNKNAVKACAVLMLMLFFLTGCGEAAPTGTLTSTDEAVGFFDEEVYIEKTIETPVYYTEAEIKIEDTYTLQQDGNTYQMELKDSKIVEAPIGSRTATLQYSQTFIDVQGEDDIPKSMSVKYYEDGLKPLEGLIILADKEGTIKSPRVEIDPNAPMLTDENGNQYAQCYVYDFSLPLKETKAGDPVWIEFSAPMIFTDYGAAYYKLNANTYLPHADSAPVVDGYEDAILEYLGLSGYSYRIGYAAWDGGTYTNSSGVLCRDAVMYGERLVNTTVATYGDTVPLETVTGYKGVATYLYRGIARNTKKVRTVTLAGIAVFAVLLTALLFLFAKKKKNAKENQTI